MDRFVCYVINLLKSMRTILPSPPQTLGFLFFSRGPRTWLASQSVRIPEADLQFLL